MPEDLKYLLDTTDANEWASAYVRLFGGDEGHLLAWFASAIETGRSAGESKCLDAADEIERLRAAILACEKQYQEKVTEVLEQMTRADRLQALINAYADDWKRFVIEGTPDGAVHDALLDAASPQEDDR